MRLRRHIGERFQKSSSLPLSSLKSRPWSNAPLPVAAELCCVQGACWLQAVSQLAGVI